MRNRLLYRSAVLSWIAVILSLALFLVLILPSQRDMLRDRLASTAEVIATSIHQVTVTAIVVEDYSPVIDHCLKVVQERPEVQFIVIAGRDGFSLIHTANGWRFDPDGSAWQGSDTPTWTFEQTALADDEVFRFAHPLRYSGIDWGWIHIGLSLEQYRADLRSTYLRLAGIGGACLLVASILSLLFARRLSRPILHLSQVTQRLARGDLGARSNITSGDEIEALATSFNQMAENLQHAHEELEQRVQERTAALWESNRVLREEISDRQAAEEARQEAEGELIAQRALTVRSDRLRSLGEMAAGIAHELNQPLTGVRGHAELGLDAHMRGLPVTADEQRHGYEEIIGQADRMAHIIDHVRMFAREADRPETAVVPLNDAVGAALDLLGAQFRSRGLRLEAQLADNLPPVDVNRYSLEEAILNLLANARDAVEQRRVDQADDAGRIIVRTRAEESGAAVLVEVEDEGCGIPAEVQDRVFEPFFSTKDPDKGTGLGLAISRSIVESFDGSLTLTSSPSQGTMAVVRLPAATYEAAPEEPSRKSSRRRQ